MSEQTVNGMAETTAAAGKTKPRTAKTAAPRKAAKRTASKRPGTKRPTTKRPTKRKAKAKTGADRRPGEWIMSVHIPMALLKKLDAKVKALAKAGKDGASRSAFCVLALRSKL